MRTDLAFLFGGILFVASTVSAQPPEPMPDVQCKFRHRVSEASWVAELPMTVQNVLLRRMDPQAREDAKLEWHQVMAPRGGNFNSTDVIVRDYPLRRFIRAGHLGNEWFVWFERGGFAYAKYIAVFELKPGRAGPTLAASVVYTRENPCVLTDNLLDGEGPAASGTDRW